MNKSTILGLINLFIIIGFSASVYCLTLEGLTFTGYYKFNKSHNETIYIFINSCITCIICFVSMIIIKNAAKEDKKSEKENAEYIEDDEDDLTLTNDKLDEYINKTIKIMSKFMKNQLYNIKQIQNDEDIEDKILIKYISNLINSYYDEDNDKSIVIYIDNKEFNSTKIINNMDGDITITNINDSDDMDEEYKADNEKEDESIDEEDEIDINDIEIENDNNDIEVEDKYIEISDNDEEIY